MSGPDFQKIRENFKISAKHHPNPVHIGESLPKPKPTAKPPLTATPSFYDVCAKEKPCQNNGTCVTTANGVYYCECAAGFTNDNCTESVDFDPCASAPCLNGGSCSAKAGKVKTTFDCYCPKGFAGERCELKPCVEGPCKNNGTCRTTRAGPPWFFCECQPEWGGKTCIVGEWVFLKLEWNFESGEFHKPHYPSEIPSTNKTRNFGGAQQLSSGKVEWIKEIQRSLSQNQSSSEDVSSETASKPGSSGEWSTSGETSANTSLNSTGTTTTNSSVNATKQPLQPAVGNLAPIVGKEEPTRTLSSSKANKEKEKGDNGSGVVGLGPGHLLIGLCLVVYTLLLS